MRIIVLLFFGWLLIGFSEAKAQKAEKTVAGIYALQGVMETAAGLNIKPDHTFEYGFTYGAADKWGKGSWKIAGGKLVLQSKNPQPAQDFTLQRASKVSDGGVKLTVTTRQGQPLAYVKCRLGQETAETDAKGQVTFPNMADGKLEMYHPIFSTRLSQVNLDPKHNNFLIWAADLTEVYFNNFSMEVSGNELISTQLPGMPATDAAGNLKRYVFTRQK